MCPIHAVIDLMTYTTEYITLILTPPPAQLSVLIVTRPVASSKVHRTSGIGGEQGAGAGAGAVDGDVEGWRDGEMERWRDGEI